MSVCMYFFLVFFGFSKLLGEWGRGGGVGWLRGWVVVWFVEVRMFFRGVV